MSTSENFSINTSKIFGVKKGFAGILAIVLAIVIAAAVFGIKNVLTKPLKVSSVQTASSFQSKQGFSIDKQSLRSDDLKQSLQSDDLNVLGSSSELHSELEKYLVVEAALLGVSDNVSLYFKDLASSNEVSIDPTRSWIPASTIKSFVVPEAFRQRRLGIIDFNDTVVISSKNVVPTELETDDFPRLREGVAVTIGQLVAVMVEQSDNTAYNTLLDVLDRRNINQTLRNLGITETVVGEKLNLDDNQFAIDLNVSGRQPVTTTAKDLASLFNLMYLHKIPDSEEMLTIFKNQKINNMIPAFLPGTVKIAHKTGDWAPIYHDGGIVYKSNAPFILAVFTNSNDPSVIAKIARVAYQQDAKAVGLGEGKVQENSNTPVSSARPKYFLAAADIASSRVLAAETNEHLPKITAADLGITASDLKSNVASGVNIRSSLIGPTSPYYSIKRLVDYLRLKFANGPKQRIGVEISLSQNRLAELEGEIKKGNIASAQSLLEESEQSLKQSVVESQSFTVSDSDLLKIKQANDLSFKTLAKIAQDLPDDKKEAYVNMVYQFVQSNKREVKPTVNKSLTAIRSTNQEPIIGIVTNVTDKAATVKFDNGSTKEVVVNDAIPTRDFNSKNADNKLVLDVGSKVAIVGQTTKDGKIIPQFILKNVPKNIPDKKSGAVIEVDPNNKTLKIINPSGFQEEVKVTDETEITSKDTNVSLEGIKAGSQITFSGQRQSTDNQNTSKQDQNKTPGKQESTDATTITVTKNGSGSNEQKSSPSQGQQKDQGKKEDQKNPQPPSKKDQAEPPKKEGKK